MKKNSMMIEQIFDIVCLMASYGILFLLPQKMDVFFKLKNVKVDGEVYA